MDTPPELKIDEQPTSYGAIIQVYTRRRGKTIYVGAYHGREGRYTRVVPPRYCKGFGQKSVGLTRDEARSEAEIIVERGYLG